MSRPAQVFRDFATPITVSTLTVVASWIRLDEAWDNALFAMVNLSSSETVTLTLDTSEDGTSPDSDKQQSITIAPNSQGSVELGSGMLRTYVRLCANTQSPSYNAAQVKWRLKARFG